MIGNLSGPATEFNPGLIMGKRANLQGISVGSTQMFEALNRAISASAIKPVIDKVFGFDDVKAAYQHMASGAHFGKIVIRVRSDQPPRRSNSLRTVPTVSAIT